MIAADYTPACCAAIRRRDRLARWHQARQRWLAHLNHAKRHAVSAARITAGLLAASVWFGFLASLWLLTPL